MKTIHQFVRPGSGLHIRLMKAGTLVYGSRWDTWRPCLVAAFSGHRSYSSKQMFAREMLALIKVLEAASPTPEAILEMADRAEVHAELMSEYHPYLNDIHPTLT